MSHAALSRTVTFHHPVILKLGLHPGQAREVNQPKIATLHARSPTVVGNAFQSTLSTCKHQCMQRTPALQD